MMKFEYKTAIVLFHHAAFGGAQRRYANLYIYLNNKYPGRFYFFVNRHYYNQIRKIYKNIDTASIRVVDLGISREDSTSEYDEIPRFYHNYRYDPLVIDKNTSILRKVYWYFKNRMRQYRLHKKVERYRKELDIKIFYGVYSGVLPLVFYFNKKPRNVGIIFSNMDSNFYEIVPDEKRFWYRKYYSFNYALYNSDTVDFLNPYILKGLKERNVKIKDENVYISTCSFTDYSRCTVGKKGSFEIAFASRLEPEKNPFMYLEAIKEISPRHPDVKFHLLGEGSMVNEITRFIQNNSLSGRVNFQFHKNPADILKETSVFASLQPNTNYPSQSVLEAMACGNAIVATNVGDTHLFINESNGILIQPELKELVTALEFLINNRQLTRELGLNAKDFALENHTIERYADYFLGVVDDTYRKVFKTNE